MKPSVFTGTRTAVRGIFLAMRSFGGTATTEGAGFGVGAGEDFFTTGGAGVESVSGPNALRWSRCSR